MYSMFKPRSPLATALQTLPSSLPPGWRTERSAGCSPARTRTRSALAQSPSSCSPAPLRMTFVASLLQQNDRQSKTNVRWQLQLKALHKTSLVKKKTRMKHRARHLPDVV